MQMIHPLHAGAPARTISAPTLAPQQRAVQSKIRARQQKILKTAVLLLFSATLICVLLIWRSDSARITLTQRSLDGPMTAIQNRIDELAGFLPSTLTESESTGIQSYAGMAERRYALQSGQPTIIAVSRRVSLMLRPDGRYVIIYDRGKLHSQWMPNARFEAAVREQSEQIHAFEDRLLSRPPELP